LILSAHSTCFEEVSTEFQVLGILGHGVQAEDSEFQLGMARIAMRLTFARAEVGNEAVHVLATSRHELSISTFSRKDHAGSLGS
jgi:hypothetical protein